MQETQVLVHPVTRPLSTQVASYFWVLLGGLALLTLLSVTLGISLGPVQVPVGDVWGIAAYKVGWIERGEWLQAHENIVWLIRFPRVLLALFVGAGLAVVGVAIQAMVRNGLADPFILGVSSGASVGAVLAIGMGAFAFAGVYAVSVGGFMGAIVSFIAVFVIANGNGRMTPQRLILAGIAVSYIFSGITSFITLTSDNRQLAGQVLSWTLGSLARATWVDVGLPALALLAGTLYLVLRARSLNALLMGDEAAITLGVNTLGFRRELFILASLLTGIMVAVSGVIGFIGLVIPHTVRLLVGSDHRRVLPIALFVGSVFLIWVDVIARTAFDPVELPVGVITSVLGGPFFLWLMWKRQA